jgi:hypothetical protein
MGDTDNAQILSDRAANWTLLLNPETGFLSPRYLDGTFKEEIFDEFGWGDSYGYTEAGPWQYRLEIPYDPSSLQTTLADIGIDAASIVEEVGVLPHAIYVFIMDFPCHMCANNVVLLRKN